MVSLAGRRGTSTFGCLLTLALFLGALYYGTEVGKIYWRYYAIRDAMETEARFAGNQSDEAIRRTLLSRIDELGLPREARRLNIRRSGPPNRIVIRTEYREVLELPIVEPRWITLKPRVESRF